MYFFRTFVFPGGTWGNIEVLKKYNFLIYRRRTDFELSYPYRDNYNLLVTVSSAQLEYNQNYGWTSEYYISRLNKYVKKAIETHTIAHFWFHPSLDPYFLKHIFSGVLSYASSLRREGLLWIGTMKDIALHVNRNGLL